MKKFDSSLPLSAIKKKKKVEAELFQKGELLLILAGLRRYKLIHF